jgi:flavin-dependent dehydrogenase
MLSGRGRVVAWLPGLAVAVGCQYVPKRDFVALQNHNQALEAQVRAQTARIENLEVHARHLSDQLIAAEGELAALDRRGQRMADRAGGAGD